VPIILTFQILGADIGWARLVGIVGFSVIIGLTMDCLFKEQDTAKESAVKVALPEMEISKAWWQQLIFFGLLIAVMVLVTYKNWIVSGALAAVFALYYLKFYSRSDLRDWMSATYQFVKSILIWFVLGSIGATLIAVFVPNSIISDYAGGNSFLSSLIASVFGSIMYLCPPSEVLYTRAFLDLGMGKGPALAFLLTSPAVSLPSLLVLFRIIGVKKALVYSMLLIVMAAVTGWVFGLIAAPGLLV
jgi:uncharacterized protein